MEHLGFHRSEVHKGVGAGKKLPDTNFIPVGESFDKRGLQKKIITVLPYLLLPR